jgi:hypothetical protein
MRVGFVVSASAATLLLLAAACSSFGASDPSTAADASASDAPASDATTADAAPPGAILVEGFETDQGACGAWQGTRTTSVERIADAGTDGSFGCRMCATASLTSYFSIDKQLGLATGAPQPAYFMEANMRVESGTSEVAAAFAVAGIFDVGSPSTGPGWHHVSKRVSPEAGVPLIAIASGHLVDGGAACVVVDDIVVRKVD